MRWSFAVIMLWGHPKIKDSPASDSRSHEHLNVCIEIVFTRFVVITSDEYLANTTILFSNRPVLKIIMWAAQWRSVGRVGKGAKKKNTRSEVGMEGRQLNRNKKAPIGTRKNSGIWYLKGGGRSTPSNTTQKSARVVCWQQSKAEITPATAVRSRSPRDLMYVPDSKRFIELKLRRGSSTGE